MKIRHPSPDDRSRIVAEGETGDWDHQHLVAGKAHVIERQFDEGDFKSVGIEECIERLNRASGFSLNNSQRQVITTLRNLKNRVAHYIGPSADTAALKAAAAAGLNLFIEINNSEFLDKNPCVARTMPELVVDLQEYDDFVKERLSSLSSRLQSAVRSRTHNLDECSHCLQNAAIITGDDKVQCLFCGHGMCVQEYAELISEDGSVEACPECGRQSVARHQWKDRKPTCECFYCGYFRGRNCSGVTEKGRFPGFTPTAGRRR